MATNEISNETLLTNEISNETLDEMFNRGLNIHDDLEICEECQNSETFQHKVKKGILILEDATRLVSVLDIFSRNETVSEVPTEHLKFFLLPMLLGSLNSKITGGDRSETIKIVETYYEDFLQRIKDYGIASVPNLKRDSEAPNLSNTKPNVAQINRERDEKIRRYKESKEIEAGLKELKIAIANPSCDNEVLRDYFLKLIRKFVFSALDEIYSFKTEKEILAHMAQMREQSGGACAVVAVQRPKIRPLKPIIITRDAIQKEIFGMGYKNLPVMSIEEFYEDRARKGWYDKPAAQSLPNYTIGEVDASEPDAPPHDVDANEKDDKEDQDDPEELERQRNFDEYKDDHKRGEGNRHNRG